jgi:Tol biopolymer transport system component
MRKLIVLTAPMRLPRLIVRGRKRIAALVVAVAAIALIAIGGSAQAKVSGPNGRIAFARNDPASTEEDTFAFTANPDGSDPQQLFPGHHAGSPRWSPDGTEVAVLSDGGLPCCTVAAVVINPDTGSYRVLPMQEPDTLFTACPVWSADGKRLACDGESDSDPSRNGIYTIRSSDGGDLKRITNAAGVIDTPIDYSPDGNQIVFGRTSPDHNCDALFVVNVSGSGLQKITPCGFVDDDGSWSPDGTKIAFEHRGSLFVVHPDGTRLAKIPLATKSRSFAGDFSWSPDGTKLVFLLGTPTGPHSFQEGIATANADGSDVHQATISPTFDHQADWGPHALITP